jgi:hypothetical protein
MSFGIWHVLTLLFAFATWVVPAVIVGFSPRVSGGAKVLWVIAALAGSWLGLIAFLLVTQPQQRGTAP